MNPAKIRRPRNGAFFIATSVPPFWPLCQEKAVDLRLRAAEAFLSRARGRRARNLDRGAQVSRKRSRPRVGEGDLLQGAQGRGDRSRHQQSALDFEAWGGEGNGADFPAQGFAHPRWKEGDPQPLSDQRRAHLEAALDRSEERR